MCNKNFPIVLSFALALLLLAPGEASAAAMKLGDVFKNVTNSIGLLPWLLSGISYISGLLMGIWALFKFKDHVDNPSQNPISAGVKRFVAAGMFLSGPYMYEVLFGSVHGGSATAGYNELTNTGRTIPGSMTPGSLDKMVVDLMTNVGGPVEILLTIFCYIAGIAFLMVGINRLTKRMEEGPRGPAGAGTIMTFVASAALFSFGDSMGVFTSSLFGDSTINTDATILATVIPDAADRDRVEAVVEGVMAFVMIVGYIAFIRGWFVLKSFADGQQGATLAQGLTFLFGGALAINLGELVNVLQTTLGIGGISFG